MGIKMQDSRFKIQDSKCEINGDKGAEMAFRRSTIYELLSHAFAEPSADFILFLSGGEFLHHIEQVLNLHPLGTEMDMRPFSMLTEAANTHGIEGLNPLYNKLTSPEMNFLYEGNFHPPLNAAEEMADIAGFYRAFGLDFDGDRPDHVSTELEFMRLLTMKEAKARADREEDKADVCVSAQRGFLSSHLGRWTSVLSRMTEGTAFYSLLGKLLENWVALECKHLTVETDEIFYAGCGTTNEEISCIGDRT